MSAERSAERSARILAVANQKGGVGKTTTTLTLGAALAREGKKTLVVDLDPHACASVHLAYYPENLDYTVLDVFTADPEAVAHTWEQAVCTNCPTGFDFVAGNIKLSDMEMDLKSRPGKGLLLKQACDAIRHKYDYVLLDCPPHVGVVLINSLVASDLAVIPVQTDFLALHGLKLIFDTMRMLNKAMPEPIAYRALPTMYDKRTVACRRVLKILRDKLSHRVFETVIHIDTKFREAGANGKTIYDIDPETRGAREYSLLAKELMHYEIS